MIPNVTVLAKMSDKMYLAIMEAFLINEHSSIINVQTSDFNRIYTKSVLMSDAPPMRLKLIILRL